MSAPVVATGQLGVALVAVGGAGRQHGIAAVFYRRAHSEAAGCAGRHDWRHAGAARCLGAAFADGRVETPLGETAAAARSRNVGLVAHRIGSPPGRVSRAIAGGTCACAWRGQGVGGQRG